MTCADMSRHRLMIANHGQPLADQQSTTGEGMAEIMDSHIIEPSPRPDSPPRMLQVGQMAARLASDCCSARGLCADRRDKLLKLLDTRGQNWGLIYKG